MAYKIGGKVVVVSKECCNGFEVGTIGIIELIAYNTRDLCIKVVANGDYWFHCRNCCKEIN